MDNYRKYWNANYHTEYSEKTTHCYYCYNGRKGTDINSITQNMWANDISVYLLNNNDQYDEKYNFFGLCKEYEHCSRNQAGVRRRT